MDKKDAPPPAEQRLRAEKEQREKQPNIPPEMHRLDARSLRLQAQKEPERADYLRSLAARSEDMASLKEITVAMDHVLRVHNVERREVTAEMIERMIQILQDERDAALRKAERVERTISHWLDLLRSQRRH